MNEEFNKVVDLYKNLSYKEKQKELIKEFKLHVAAMEKINKDLGINHELLMNRELIDVNKDDATDDDYLEAYFVYLNMIADSISAFAEHVAKNFYE